MSMAVITGVVLGRGMITSSIAHSEPVVVRYFPAAKAQTCKLCTTLHGCGLPVLKASTSTKFHQQQRIRALALAMEATQEAFSRHMKHLEESFLVPLPPNNRADDSSLNNPLLRLERMGCGWLGVILEWEGVIVEDDLGLERKAWTALAEEEGRNLPPAFLLKRAEGMKNEQAISEVLCWSRNFQQIKRLAQRKEELYEQMQRGTYRLLPGSRDFLEILKRYKVPVAIASTRPRKYVERAIEAVGMEGFPNEVIAAEDVHRGKPDPEMFLYAAERLGFIPERCIVFGNSNSSVEAAHDACMKCVAVAGTHPVFELGAADLVVRKMTELSFVDLKNLADLDSPEFQPSLEPQVEVEEQLKPLAFLED